MNSFNDRSLNEILHGNDMDLLEALSIVSDEVKRRNTLKLSDPEVRERIEKSMESVFGTTKPRSR